MAGRMMADRMAARIGDDDRRAVWHGGMGHRIIGTDSGIQCFRCGMAADDGTLETLIPDCGGPEVTGHHWIGIGDWAECAYGDAVSTADAYPPAVACTRA